MLAEDGNIKDLAQKMKRLMADVELRETMGTKAINNIARYQPKAIMSQWMKLFESI